jgi:hypothetical protein
MKSVIIRSVMMEPNAKSAVLAQLSIVISHLKVANVLKIVTAEVALAIVKIGCVILCFVVDVIYYVETLRIK